MFGHDGNFAMHDIKLIRDNPSAFDAALKRRGLEPMSASLLARYEGSIIAVAIVEKKAGAAKAAAPPDAKRAK
ncbi:MAG: seryl-tRNA synthetase [Bradyrhizobium sp.]|nr:seryl-tRNA synthetase [Bradyrhizobium sp.]